LRRPTGGSDEIDAVIGRAVLAPPQLLTNGRPPHSQSCRAMSWIADLGASLVGIGGLTFGWAQSRQRLAQDRTLVDLAAVRCVLEDGAVHLHRVAYALDLVKLDLRSNAESVYAKLTELGERYDELVERMKIRLGAEHEVTRKFMGANAALLDAYRAIGRAANLHIPIIEADAPDSGPRQAMQLLEQEQAIVTASRERFDTHRTEYIDAAVRTAAVRLPSR
jgi:hypothetical protein